MPFTIEKITWNNAHYKWNDFKLGNEYQQYLLDTYGITVEDGGRVIWDHVLKVIEITIIPGAVDETGGIFDKKSEKVKKKIKLIFIMDDIQVTQTKEIKTKISPKIVRDIKNKIEEEIKTKITLSDVQIIKG